MSLETKNHKLYKYEDNDIADLRFMQDTMDKIDKGLILDVGSSTGTGNDYVLNLGSITLSSANKGISFKFWADKDSTGAVTINGTYHLVKANGNPIKNIKQNAPYTITYDGNTSFFLSSGGADESDSTTVGIDGSKVLAPETFIGSDGEIHTGTIPIRNSADTTLNCGQSIKLPAGYYPNDINVIANSKGNQSLKSYKKLTSLTPHLTSELKGYEMSTSLGTRYLARIEIPLSDIGFTPTGAYLFTEDNSAYGMWFNSRMLSKHYNTTNSNVEMLEIYPGCGVKNGNFYLATDNRLLKHTVMLYE